MVMKRFAVGVLGLLLPILGAAAQAAAPVIDLPQCIGSALAGGPDNRILQAGLEVSRSQFAATVSQGAFSLRATLGYNGSWTLGEEQLVRGVGVSGGAGTATLPGPQIGLALIGPLTSVNVTASPYVGSTDPAAAATGAVGVSLTQTLWNGYPGGTARATVDRGRLALQLKELSTQAGRLNLVYQIKQAYFTMLTAQRSVSLQKEILQKQESLLQQVDAVYRLKQASAVDLKTAEVNARSARADMDGFLQAQRVAGIRLANLMGRPADQPFAVAEVEAPQPPARTLEQAIADGLLQRTDLRQVELNRGSLAIDLALARGQAQPSVSVTAGLNGTVAWTGGAGWLATAGLRLGLPVFDSGAARHLQEADQQQDRLYALQEEQLRNSIRADILDAYGALQVQLERVDVARINADTLALQFELVQTQNRFGTATYQDLLTAAVNESNARTALARAKSDAQLAALKLQNVMGY